MAPGYPEEGKQGSKATRSLRVKVGGILIGRIRDGAKKLKKLLSTFAQPGN